MGPRAQKNSTLPSSMTHSRATLQRGNQRFGRAAGDHPDGASPACSAWVFTGTQTSASNDKAAWDTHPLPPACPLPSTSLFTLPSTPGKRGHTWMEVLILRGCPSPITLHKIQVAACMQQALWGFPSPHYTPWQSPQKRLSSFCRTELNHEAGVWDLSMWGKGDWKKSIW